MDILYLTGHAFKSLHFTFVCKTKYQLMGKLWRVKIIFLHPCRGYILRVCLLKSFTRHIHLVHKRAAAWSFLRVFFLLMIGYFLFSILKALLVSFFPFIIRQFYFILYKFSKIKNKIFQWCLTLKIMALFELQSHCADVDAENFHKFLCECFPSYKKVILITHGI